ncbi:MAG TPA: glutathione S-transferase family protein [Xanthomonadales bacterium]|nr:glutathione S-transferase family protein [Xanthomonadales bacterium]
MYTLYYAPGAASLVVHWLLIELGVPHELKKLDIAAKEHKTAEYLKLNPAGVVPTLIVDGAPVTECAALALLLAERHPEAGLEPARASRERATYLMWTLHLANTLQPAFRHWWYPAEAAGEANAAAAQEMAGARIAAVFDRLDAHLAAHGPYICGASISAVDFLATMLMRWSRNMHKPATEWPNLAAYAARMKARPSFKVLYEREGLTEWA